MSRIYCIEDDKSICNLVEYTLEKSDFEACGFNDGASFFDEISQKEAKLPDLILLDIMLPGEDGYEILRKLRADSRTENIPVIMLTAKGSEYDKVLALDQGADDYITKPFGMMELISRIKAVLRRYGKAEEKEVKDAYSCGDILLDDARHEVFVKKEEVILTFKEYELLKILMSHPGIVYSRDQLLNMVWGFDYDGESRTLDVHIGTLRQKLGEGGSLIETVRGVGYRMTDRK
jgi:two-component system, OmpR family, alkaline phosphatase synthesis response regulator PhoP